MRTRPIIAAVTSVAIGTIAVAGAAQGVRGLEDLVGARGSSAESELRTRGFAMAGNRGAASLWWNVTSKTCASMLIENGRVDSIEPASARDCGHDAVRANTDYVNHGVPSERTTVAQMPKYCAGAAAEKFGESPRSISTQMPIPDHGMYSVFGQYPPNGAGTVFICTFTHDGTLVSVDKE